MSLRPDREVEHPYTRLRDFLIALVMLLLFFPLMLVIGACIFLACGRPVLYSEKRAGLKGREYILYKFRTLDHAPDARIPADEFACRVNKNGTPEACRRPFFRVLRKYSLDELPQVWNVLTGDMSIVGPRPMPVWELNYRFGPDASKIISVRPGLTGLWQVSGRNDLSAGDRRRLDLYYAENRNGWLDFKIILKTFSAVLSGRGAY